ncbi:hypothetical protein quinque_004623 [Culex quinquefasciatus]
MLSAVILLFLLSQVSTDLSVSQQLQCKNPKSTICSIQVLKYVDFRPPRLPPLEGKHTLQIRSGTVTRFSKELQPQLASILKLQLGRLNIESLWIMPTLLQLSAENNLIEQLVIEEQDDNVTEYSLQYLNLANNRLRSIRELNDLQALKELRLDNNLLEYIEMDTFAGMNKLKKLSLSNNRINAIATAEPIELPSLELFSLAHNNLTKLALKDWTLLQLTDLQLNDNRLISLDVDNFEQFVSLEKLAIAGNSWYCFWLSKAIKNIARYVALNGKDEDCPAMPIDDICCSMTVVSDDQPAHADIAERIRLFEESQTRMKSELLQKLNRSKAWWNEEFAKIDGKTKDLKKEADELARLSSDDNKVKPEDVAKLSEVLMNADDNVDNIKSLVESNKQFEKDITNLLYTVIEQKNRLLQTVKSANNLKEEMHAYKISFDNNVK